jgi:hypothetical protein
MPSSFINNPEYWLQRAKEMRTLTEGMGDCEHHLEIKGALTGRGVKVQETRPKIKRYEATEIAKIKVLRAEMQIRLNHQADKLFDFLLNLLYGAQCPSIFLLGSLLLDRRRHG